MENMATVIVLLTVVTVLAEITDKIRIPYPILLVLAGIGDNLRAPRGVDFYFSGSHEVLRWQFGS